ncbi:MAG: four helix bundle protein [Candidatus Saccharimonadales bacterium]
MESELPIILKVYDLYKLLTEANWKLAKIHRYGLGISTETTALNLLEDLIMAKYAPKPNKAKYLILSIAQIETLRFKLRLYLELALLNETKVLQMQAVLQEIGRMATGWRKSVGA